MVEEHGGVGTNRRKLSLQWLARFDRATVWVRYGSVCIPMVFSGLQRYTLFDIFNHFTPLMSLGGTSTGVVYDGLRLGLGLGFPAPGVALVVKVVSPTVYDWERATEW